MVVRRIGVVSLGRLMGGLYGSMGLIFGAIFALISLLGAGLGATMSETGGPEAWMAPLFGVGAVIFLPLFYGLMGFLMGMLTAALYNLIAGWLGGVELEVQ